MYRLIWGNIAKAILVPDMQVWKQYWNRTIEKLKYKDKLDLVQSCETQKISMNNPLFKNIPHVGSFWHLLIVNLYFYISLFDSWECHSWYPWTILSSKIYNMLGLSGTLSYTVFVYLCISVFVFLYLHVWFMAISFFISSNNLLFKNIQHVGSFWYFVVCFICVFVYLCICICVFVFVYLCMRHLVISVLISLDQVLSDIWRKINYQGNIGAGYVQVAPQTPKSPPACVLRQVENLPIYIINILSLEHRHTCFWAISGWVGLGLGSLCGVIIRASLRDSNKTTNIWRKINYQGNIGAGYAQVWKHCWKWPMEKLKKRQIIGEK